METHVKHIFSKDLITLRDTDTLHQAEDLMNSRQLPTI